ncbi:hypothetical protein R3P38DRAFT_2780461 [Favolaschia claudopus]|uniref:F-box domain-containing protein n=1 Tax=Favolaschia claudopus TaxID=2862362 RepID=A0AAW0B9F3_9AGAR
MSRDMAASKLRTHIDELSSNISDLINQRVQARRELNHLLDPMARLPLELQSHIFLCVEHKLNAERKADPNDVPLVFLSVCHLWHVIALSTPKLWTEITIDSLPRSANYVTLRRKWMERAGKLPLSLSLGGFSDPNDTAFDDLVKRHQDQVQSLTLRWKLFSRPHPHNGKQPIHLQGYFPSLRRLAIHGGGDDIYASEDVLEVLRAAPKVSYCQIFEVYCDEDDNPENFLDSSSLPLTLPLLEELRLGVHEPDAFLRNSGAGAAILKYLRLPALRKLSLTVLDIDDDDIVSFFTRSSPPLELLSLSVEHDWPRAVVKRCLRLLPTVTALQLCSRANDYLCFVEVLGTSFEILPNLRELSLSTLCTATIDYTALIHALTARRASPLKQLAVYLYPVEWDDNAHRGPISPQATALPDGAAKFALQRFVKEGMEIFVGFGQTNLVKFE